MNAQSNSHTRLHGRWLLIARVTWIAIAILTTIMHIVALPVAFNLLRTPCYQEPCDTPFQTPSGTESAVQEEASLKNAWQSTIWEIMAWLVPLGVALLIFLRRSDDWMAHLASIMLMTILVISPWPEMLAAAQPLWYWPRALLWAVGLASSVGLFYLFPDGRLVPRWTRGLAIALLVIIGALAVEGAPFLAGFPIFVVILITGTVFQIYRYRRVSDPLQRQQTKWVVLGIIGMVLPMLIVLFVAFLNPSFNPLLQREPRLPQDMDVFSNMVTAGLIIPFCFLPVTLAFSMLRYRLWDVDILINRTLVYGALTAGIIALYVLLVGALSLLSQTTGNLLISLLATGLIAFLFQPLRERLQRGVNRMMYGERDDPYVVLSQLGQRLETVLTPNALLSTIVETIGRTLKLPFVEICLSNDKEGSVSSGEPQTRTIAFSLNYQNEAVGELHVAPRIGESLSSADHNLLKDLARQTGVAIHAARLTADLQRSREQLVLAREEERRRLRRDLHDDLAPTLASLGLTASTAADLISTNPATATALVKELQTEIRATVRGIRRLVYDLRPPTLDELGLLAAIRERAAQYSNAPDGFHVTVDAPAELPALPAAVEVAAYRIVQEALENVSKHSRARTCVIRFANHSGLEIEITDDGIGLPPKLTPGVGLRSMRERAEELGGRSVIERGVNGGTRVLAHLPMGESNGSIARTDRG